MSLPRYQTLRDEVRELDAYRTSCDTFGYRSNRRRRAPRNYLPCKWLQTATYPARILGRRRAGHALFYAASPGPLARTGPSDRPCTTADSSWLTRRTWRTSSHLHCCPRPSTERECSAYL